MLSHTTFTLGGETIFINPYHYWCKASQRAMWCEKLLSLLSSILGRDGAKIFLLWFKKFLTRPNFVNIRWRGKYFYLSRYNFYYFLRPLCVRVGGRGVVKSNSTLEVTEVVRTFSSPKSVNTPPHSQGMQNFALFAFAFAFVLKYITGKQICCVNMLHTADLFTACIF